MLRCGFVVSRPSRSLLLPVPSLCCPSAKFHSLRPLSRLRSSRQPSCFLPTPSSFSISSSSTDSLSSFTDVPSSSTDSASSSSSHMSISSSYSVTTAASNLRFISRFGMSVRYFSQQNIPDNTHSTIPPKTNTPLPSSAAAAAASSSQQQQQIIKKTAPKKWRIYILRFLAGSMIAALVFGAGIVLDALLFDEYKHRAMPWEEEVAAEIDSLSPDTQLAIALAHLSELGEDVDPSMWSRRVISPLRTLLRGVFLLTIFLPLALAAPILLPHNQNLWYRWLVWSLRTCGASFIKLGQWLGTRGDLIGDEMSSHLRELQSRAPVHSFEETKEVLEKAYQKPLGSIFESFNHIPLASGAIAQVHLASINGREVAVKVRHPGVVDTLYRDLTLAISVVRIASKMFPKWVGYFRPEDAVVEFSKCMLDQLDLVKEANNLLHFRSNFAGDDHVIFPEPFMELCQPAVLVESFESGASIVDFMNRPDCGRTTANMLGRACLQMYLKMMITDNFSHDDLHPGNVLVRWAPIKRPVPQWVDWTYRFVTGIPQDKPDAVPPPPGMSPQLVILDAGLVTQLNRKDWRNFVDLFKAVITYNSERAARLMIERAPRRVATKEQEARFQAQLTELIEGVWQKDLIINVRVGEILRRALDIARTNNIALDTKFASRVLGTIVVEGMARQVNPQINMVVEATAFFLAHSEARRRMIRDSLGMAKHILHGAPEKP